MNPARPIFAVLGLVCIGLFYIFRNSAFLALALIFFVVGLFFMGAFKRRKKAASGEAVRSNKKRT